MTFLLQRPRQNVHIFACRDQSMPTVKGAKDTICKTWKIVYVVITDVFTTIILIVLSSHIIINILTIGLHGIKIQICRQRCLFQTNLWFKICKLFKNWKSSTKLDLTVKNSCALALFTIQILFQTDLKPFPMSYKNILKLKVKNTV